MFAALLASLVLSGAPQTAPQPAPRTESQTAAPAEPSATQLPEILVDGVRPREAATRFVEEIDAAPRGSQTARWNGPVCVGVSNMRSPFGQYLVDHVSAQAAELGLEIGQPGCRANVLIFATEDGPAMATRLVSETGRGFRPTDSGTQPSRAALREFQTSDAPVRWWHVAMPVGSDLGDVAIRRRGAPPPAITVHTSSHLASSIRYDMAWVIIVIDLNRTRAVPLGTLADYVSMVALAQIDPAADLGTFDTVLNAFDHPDQVHGLSDWDRDYLTALYKTRADRKEDYQRQQAIIEGLVRARAASRTTPILAPQE